MNNKAIDILFSILSYITAGFLGLIYLIFAYMTKKQISSFALFNIYQSLFIAISIYILSFVYGIFINFAGAIPFIKNYVVLAHNFIFMMPVVFGCTVAGVVILLFYLYICVYCLMYKKPYIPLISQIIEQNFGG